MADYENVLLVKNEVFVFRIPPRTTNRGYRAADWTLDNPDWTGRLRVVSKGKDLIIKLEDKSTGELFAKCPVDAHPGIAVESVLDSSRYFVIRLLDDNGRTAFIGIGFADRGDSFDLNVAIQDHFKWLKQEKEAEQVTKQLGSEPPLDLGFKAGQTIKLNLNTKRPGDESRGSGKPRGGLTGTGPGMLPPPPPPAASRSRGGRTPDGASIPAQPSPVAASGPARNTADLLLLELGDNSSGDGSSQSAAANRSTASDDWMNFN